MFGKLMDGIDDDYLRYVFHVQVLTEPAAEPDLDQANYVAADDPVQGDGGIAAAFAAADPGRDRGRRPPPPAWPAATAPRPGSPPAWPMTGRPRLPIVKSEREKLGRNEPCWCGSGKKFKLCHGAN